MLEAIADPTGYVDTYAHEVARLQPQALLARWGAARTALAEALRGYPDGREDAVVRPADVADVDGHRALHGDLGARARRLRRPRRPRPSPPTGSGTSPTSASAPATSPSACTSSTPPAEEFRVELTAPSGEIWTWGPDDAAQRVTGSAHDFCLLVTQRVHRDDTDLVASGADAEKWLTIAQAFAGPPGAGREPQMSSPPDRQLLRLLRRPALRDARDARGRRARRPHRRLPRRADHADPRQGHDEGRLARLRAHLRHARSRTASASRWTRA